LELITLSVGAVAIAAITSGTPQTASSTQVTTTNVTVNKPSSSTGDLLLATIAIHGGSSAVVSSVPSGWHLIASTTNDASLSLISYWKVDSGSEPSNYTWVINGQTTAEGAITPYSGVDNLNLIDVAPFQGNSGLSASATTTAITTATASDTVVAVFAVDEGKSSNSGAYFRTPTGMTEKLDASNVPFGPSLALDEEAQSAAGTFGSVSSSISGGNKPKNWATQVIALRHARTYETFDSSGTWTAPPGITSVTVDMWGGGGGGGGGTQANDGGAAGAYVHQIVSVTPGNVYTLAVGTGGGGGVGGGAAGAGRTGYATGGNGSSLTNESGGGG
jgi:hypothetical protein